MRLKKAALANIPRFRNVAKTAYILEANRFFIDYSLLNLVYNLSKLIVPNPVA